MKNPYTSAIGIALIAAVAYRYVTTGQIGDVQAIITILSGLGFLAAKDGGK